MKARVVLSFSYQHSPFAVRFSFLVSYSLAPLLPEKSLNIIGYSQACLARKNPSFHY
jgi:hypothetical protein